MNSISANLNIMIKASEKASKALIRDFGEIEKLQVLVKGPLDLVSALDTKSEGPLIETCNFSISPKSLINVLEAFSLALIIILRFAEIEFICNFIFFLRIVLF